MCIRDRGNFYANVGLLHQGKIFLNYAKYALLYSKGGFYASDFGIKPPCLYIRYTHACSKVNSYEGMFYVRVIKLEVSS